MWHLLDIKIAEFSVFIRTGILTDFFLFVTSLADGVGVIFFLALVIFSFFLIGRYRAGLSIFFGTALAWCTQFLIKIMIVRPRPNFSALVEANGYSFPSGHALVSATLFGLVAYYLICRFKSFRQRLVIIAMALILPFLVGISRIYLGVHWTTDVLVGWALGLVVWGFTIWLFTAQKLK
ncbi:MAG: phosphatase PAP2 family protein [Patescibacteria group bacterium]